MVAVEVVPPMVIATAPLVIEMTIGLSQLRPAGAHLPAIGAAACTAWAVGLAVGGPLAGAVAGAAAGALATTAELAEAAGGLGWRFIMNQPAPARMAST